MSQHTMHWVGHPASAEFPLPCRLCEHDWDICVVCDAADEMWPDECPGTEMSYRQELLVGTGMLNFRDGRWRDESSRLFRPIEDDRLDRMLCDIAAEGNNEDAIIATTGKDLQGVAVGSEQQADAREMFRAVLRASWADRRGVLEDLMAEFGPDPVPPPDEPAVRIAAARGRARGSRRERKVRRLRQVRARERRT